MVRDRGRIAPGLRLALAAGLALDLLALPAGAAHGESLTLDQALERAEEVSASLRLQDLARELEDASWRTDWQPGMPSLRVEMDDIEPGGAASQSAVAPDVGARLRLPLPRPWDVATSVREGAARVGRETAQLEGLRLQLRVSVTTRFHALPLLREAVDAARRVKDARERHLALVADRRAEGLSTALDWLESEEDRRDADDDLARRVADLAEVEAELRVLLDWPEGSPLEPVPADALARVEQGIPAEGPVLDGAVERSPTVERARAGVTLAQARREAAALRGLPWIDWLQGGMLFRQSPRPTFEAGLALDLPIYEWSPARVRVATVELRSAELLLAEAERTARQSAVDVLHDAAAARERWQVARSHREALVAQAEPLMDVADPLLRHELDARLARAELRELLSLAALAVELDRVDAEAGQ